MVYTVVAAGGGMSKSGSMYHFVSVVVPVVGVGAYGVRVQDKFLSAPFAGKTGGDYDFQFDASGRVVDYKEIPKKEVK